MMVLIMFGLPCLTVIVLMFIEAHLEKEHMRRQAEYESKVNRKREVDRAFDPRPDVWYFSYRRPSERSGDVEKPSKTAVR